MFGSTIIDVGIGVVLAFLGVSLAASVLTEAISSALKIRHKTLRTGIQDLLNDREFTGFAKSLYDHALVNPLAYRPQQTGSPEVQQASAEEAKEKAGKKQPPPRSWKDFTAAVCAKTTYVALIDRAKTASTAPINYLVTGNARSAEAPVQTSPAYIQTNQFAMALRDILKINPAKTITQIDQAIGEISNDQIRDAISAMWSTAGRDIKKFDALLGQWFDNAMDRVAGLYKRYTQVIAFVCALAVAAIFNIDAIHITTALWKKPQIIAQISTATIVPGSSLAEVLKPLEASTLIGWWPDDDKGGASVPFRWYAVLGWIMVAFASLFGAPFWFDALSKLVQVRGTGAQANHGKMT